MTWIHERARKSPLRENLPSARGVLACGFVHEHLKRVKKPLTGRNCGRVKRKAFDSAFRFVKQDCIIFAQQHFIDFFFVFHTA